MSYVLGYVVALNYQPITVNKCALSEKSGKTLIFLCDEQKYRGKIADLVSSHPRVPS